MDVRVFYDRLFGTYTPAERAATVVYGLDHTGPSDAASFPRLLALPFRASERAIVPDTKVRMEVNAGR